MTTAAAPERWAIAWPHGSASVLATAGMLWDCRFRLDSGRWVAPFARAPWAEDEDAQGSPEMGGQPGHMRRLGGEFVCLPFGVGGPVRAPAPGWQALLDGRLNTSPHGPAADADWRLAAATGTSVELVLDYPGDHDVARLTRRIAAVPDRPALDLELVIEARRDGAWPVGLHPILALPERARALRLDVEFEIGLTYPGIVEPGAMLTLPGLAFSDLAAVPAPGGTVDLTRLPTGAPAEDVVQLLGIGGPVGIADEEAGYRLSIEWDRAVLPACQIWISDRALTGFPWGGRFRGLGIEPTASAFDLALPVARAANPISERGYSTVLRLEPGRPLAIRYRIAAAAL